MKTRGRSLFGLVIALAIAGTACGQPQQSANVRNSDLAHCLQPVVQADPSSAKGLTTRIFACDAVTHLVVMDYGYYLQEIVNVDPDGHPLPELFPHSEYNGPFEMTFSSPRSVHVVGLDDAENEIEWLHIERTDPQTLELRYLTPMSASPETQSCLAVDKVNAIPGKLVVRLSSKCTDSTFTSLFQTAPPAKDQPNLVVSNRENSIQIDLLLDVLTLSSVIGDANYDPFERLTGTIEGGVFKGTAWKYSQPTVETLSLPVTTQPQSTTPAVITPAPGNTTPAPLDTTQNTATVSPAGSDTTLGSTASTETIASPVGSTPAETENTTAPGGNSELEDEIRISKLIKDSCPDIGLTISPKMPALSTDLVRITPTFECDVALPEGVVMEKQVIIQNNEIMRAYGGNYAMTSPDAGWANRLSPGKWRVITFVAFRISKYGDDRFYGTDINAQTDIEIVRNENFVDCSGDDLMWDGKVLSSKCMIDNNVKMVYAKVDDTARPKLIDADSFGLIEPGFSPGHHVILLGIPQNDGMKTTNLILCSTECGTFPDTYPGIKFSIDNGTYRAEFTEECSEPGNFMWIVRKSKNMYTIPSQFVTEYLNDPGIDATVTGAGKGGSLLKGTVMTGKPPAYGNVLLVASHCGDKIAFSMFDAGTKVTEQEIAAVQDDQVISVARPRMEVPDKSMTGEAVAVPSAVESIEIAGFEVFASGKVISATARVDNGAAVRVPLLGSASVPVSQDSKVLTVTYERSDGSTVVVTKPIITEAASGTLGSSGNTLTIMLIVLAIILLVGGGLFVRGRRSRPTAG